MNSPSSTAERNRPLFRSSLKRIAGLAPALVQFRRAIEKPREIRLPHKSADTRRPISITAMMRVLGYDSESGSACIRAEAVIPDLVNNVHSLAGTSVSIESAGARETSDEHSHMYFSHFSPSNVARVSFEPCVAVNIFNVISLRPQVAGCARQSFCRFPFIKHLSMPAMRIIAIYLRAH
jgi:hypothetical protein